MYDMKSFYTQNSLLKMDGISGGYKNIEGKSFMVMVWESNLYSSTE